MFSGSSSMALLKWSTALENLAPLKAATPWLISSRDFSLLQPELNTTIPVSARTEIVVFIDLLASLHFRSHQTDLVQASALSDVDRPPNALILEIGFPLHEYDLFGPVFKNFFKAV